MSKKSKKIKQRITTENIRRPKNFTLRSYNIFISQFIQRDNYGWYNHGDGQSFRYRAEQIRQWRKSPNNRDWDRPFLKESDKLADYDQQFERIDDSFESHLYKEDGFIYYTSSINTDVAMFCLDIDSHVYNDLEASRAAANYINNTFFPKVYYDVSTHGAGIHIYVFIDFTTFPNFSITDFEIRNRQFTKYLDNLRPIIKNKFNVDLDRPKGTYPHNYDLTNRGTLCKLPLPKNQEDYNNLVNSPVFTFNDLCNSDNTIKTLLLDIFPETQDDSLEKKETEPEKVNSISETTNSAHIYTNNILGQETLFLSQKDRLQIRSNDATERTRASIRLLFRELGRRPSYEEWNQYYCNNGLNTGEETDKRKQRYEAAADYTEKTFNNIYTRAPYQFGEFIEELKNNISLEEMNRIAKTANFSGKMKYQDLDVVMGEHFICMYKNQKENLELTVPTMGVKQLFEDLSEKKIYIRSCNNDRIRGARKVLVHIGWITQLDPNYNFGVSQKWGIGENCPRYGDFITFVSNDIIQKVIKQKNNTKSLSLKG